MHGQKRCILAPIIEIVTIMPTRAMASSVVSPHAINFGYTFIA
jgi:hypothetical protein